MARKKDDTNAPPPITRAALNRTRTRMVPHVDALKDVPAGGARRPRIGAQGTFSTNSFAPGTVQRRPPIGVHPPGGRTPPPLLLLPLRLEYRFISARGTLRGEVAKVNVARRWNPAARKYEMRADRRTPIEHKVPELQNGEELWVRWVPDNGLAEEVTPPAEPFETAAVDEFRASLGGRPWFADDAVVLTAWQALLRTLSPDRALFLLRTGGTAPADWQSRYGRIPALPERIALHAIGGDGIITRLAEGAPIDPAIRLDPRALDPKGWLVDFESAVGLGMGVKVRDADKIAAARSAQWIVAAGVRGGDAADEVGGWLASAAATGRFGFVPQDTSTNSSAGTRAGLPAARVNLSEYLASVTADERGLGAAEATSAGVFAAACGIDAAPIRKAQFAADEPAADAAAMIRAVGPALLHQAFGSIPRLAALDKVEMCEFFAADMSARGPLPIVRVGQNPYGVLPVTALTDPAVSSTGAGAMQPLAEWMRTFAATFRGAVAPRANTAVPVLYPGDADASRKLARILRQYAVSRRLEVHRRRSATQPRGGRAAREYEPLACPYVVSADGSLPDELTMLLSEPLQSLPDPDEKDVDRSLLYRLIRASIAQAIESQPATSARKNAPERKSGPVLERSLLQLAKATASFPGVGENEMRRMQAAAASLVSAITRLRSIAATPDAEARLETLLLETADLFQHRVDAWATGLAHRRLRAMRRAGLRGLSAGYYGVLGKLRPQSATGTGDGYVQAPSLAQAITAAALRSAYRRHRENGAFAIDLSSRRLRRALAVLDLLKKGLSIAEVLGLHGERWLHDRQEDALILPLRTRFPFQNPQTDDAVGLRLFDGLRFLAATPGDFPARRPTLQDLQAYLRDELDALSDLLLAEAAHQRALGQAEAAKAWLAVLSGQPVPGDPAFPATPRQSQGSSHRAMFAMEAQESREPAAPREIAEPSLAALAGEQLANFASATGIVELRRNATGATLRLSVRLRDDLGMTPFDLVLGGETEVTVRMTADALRRWRTHPTLIATLGSLPPSNIGVFLAAEAQVRVDLGGAAAAIASASRLRTVAQRGRPLDAAALNAAAPPADRLTADIESSLLAQTIAQLRARCTQLSGRLTAETSAYSAARGSVLALAANLRQRMATNAASIDQAALTDFENARTMLDAALDAVSRYSEPAALKLYLSEEIIGDGRVFENETGLLLDRLNKRSAILASALASTTAAPATPREGRESVRLLKEALQAALDGEALPILPPVPRVSATTPVFDDPPVTIASALGAWATVRRGVAALTTAAADWPDVRAHRVSDAATADEPGGTEDPRDATIAPRVRHFGVIVAKPNVLRRVEMLAGWVSDEWAEQRAGREQTTGVAVNYDSPQSEAPQCWLLAVPPADEGGDWTAVRAVEFVFEALQWMKVRALSNQSQPLGAAAIPGANRVPARQTDSGAVPRLPVGRHRQDVKSTTLVDGEFQLKRGRVATGIAAADLNERRGFYRGKE